MKYLLVLIVSLNFYSKVTDIKHKNCLNNSQFINVTITGDRKYEDDYGKPLDKIIVKHLAPDSNEQDQLCETWINGEGLEIDKDGNLLLVSPSNKDHKTSIAKIKDTNKLSQIKADSLGYQGKVFSFELNPYIQIEKFDVFHVSGKKWEWGGDNFFGSYYKTFNTYHRVLFTFDGEDSALLEYYPEKKKIRKKLEKLRLQ